jgi:hypothetical protein
VLKGYSQKPKGMRMAEYGPPRSDLVEIARRNGNFKRNYGTVLGAFLYLRSLRAASGRPVSWTGLILGLVAAALSLATKLNWKWP